MKKCFKKTGCVFFAVLMVHVVIIDMAIGAPSKPKMKITKSEPTIVTSPLENIPSEKQEGGESWLSKNKWWVLLGAVAAGGAAAAASGGGGGGGGSSDSGDTGNVTVSWQD
ncbi:MAG: hypothetical protein KJ737_01180 [Proteobacteria bacterium]|nr:hypothetical protein [Pseudomonadota bacterium]